MDFFLLWAVTEGRYCLFQNLSSRSSTTVRMI
ncbi:hypothetical protein CIB84_013373 [Bambusicola thoracicus]|uniref:Uncharacterized protein n=1 Tax=Bambusicola thoracicus TaxID=9083 RepID=A0A2P4SFJ3_BAMTH|nr:hypothetical protein CIB84_013373 [Bambusicola thoracicus]